MEKLIDKLLDIVAENAHPIDNSLDYDELTVLFKKEITEQLNLAVRKRALFSFNWWQWILFCIGYSIYNQWLVTNF